MARKLIVVAVLIALGLVAIGACQNLISNVARMINP